MRFSAPANWKERLFEGPAAFRAWLSRLTPCEAEIILDDLFDDLEELWDAAARSDEPAHQEVTAELAQASGRLVSYVIDEMQKMPRFAAILHDAGAFPIANN